MTKKSFRLYFETDNSNAELVHRIIGDLQMMFKYVANIVNVDHKNSTLTLLSIGETKLTEILNIYFFKSKSPVNIYVEQFKIERYI